MLFWALFLPFPVFKWSDGVQHYFLSFHPQGNNSSEELRLGIVQPTKISNLQILQNERGQRKAASLEILEPKRFNCSSESKGQFTASKITAHIARIRQWAGLHLDIN